MPWTRCTLQEVYSYEAGIKCFTAKIQKQTTEYSELGDKALANLMVLVRDELGLDFKSDDPEYYLKLRDELGLKGEEH